MAYSDEVLADAPVMYLPMQETAGTTLADATANAHDATLEGTVALADATDPAAPSGLGSHVRLDGTTGDILLAPGSWFDPSAGYAFEGWFYVRAANSWDIFWDFTTAPSTYDMYLGSGASGLELYSGGTSLTAGAYPVGQWFQLGVSVDAAANATIIVNGASVATGAVAAETAGARDAKRIGCDAYASAPLQASVAQVSLYNAPLSVARFAAHYDARFGTAGPPPPPPVVTDSVNRANGRTRVCEWTVDVEPPVTEPKRQRAHDYAIAVSITEPTLVDGRPT